MPSPLFNHLVTLGLAPGKSVASLSPADRTINIGRQPLVPFNYLMGHTFEEVVLALVAQVKDAIILCDSSAFRKDNTAFARKLLALKTVGIVPEARPELERVLEGRSKSRSFANSHPFYFRTAKI